MGEAYIEFWKLFFDPVGRTSREDYWLVVLCHTLICVALGVVSAILSSGSNDVGLLPVYGYLLIAYFPGLMMQIRRMHDIGRSGFWILIEFVPLIGGLWFLILTILPGTEGENMYGSNPGEKW